MEVSGKIKLIEGTQQVSASFRKRNLVVVTDEQYPQSILLEFTQDKCDLLDQYRHGEDVKVSINLRGREWVNPQGETKYFNTIQGWRIERLANRSAVDQYQQQQRPPHNPHAAGDQFMNMPTNPHQMPSSPNFNEEEHDDLPF